MYRFVAAGSGKVHALLRRTVGSDEFVDVVSYTQSGGLLGIQSVGPFSSAEGAAPMVDSEGWLRFTGLASSPGAYVC